MQAIKGKVHAHKMKAIQYMGKVRKLLVPTYNYTAIQEQYPPSHEIMGTQLCRLQCRLDTYGCYTQTKGCLGCLRDIHYMFRACFQL